MAEGFFDTLAAQGKSLVDKTNRGEGLVVDDGLPGIAGSTSKNNIGNTSKTVPNATKKSLGGIAKQAMKWGLKSPTRMLGLGIGGLFIVKKIMDIFIDDKETKPSDKAKVMMLRAEYIDATGDDHRAAEDRLEEANTENMIEIEKQKARLLKAMGEF